MERCGELEGALEGLKSRYEQFFLGMVRLPPADEHAAVRRAIERFRTTSGRNTSVRFRAQSLQNRLLSYERMWQRVCREIEEGTWRRDLFKARLRAPPAATRAIAAASADAVRRIEQAGAGDGRSESPAGSVVSAGSGGSTAGSRATGPASRGSTGQGNPSDSDRVGAVPGVPSPLRSSGTDLSDDRLKPLYDAYLQAKRRCRESTEGMSYDSLATSLRRQVPALLEKHGAASVELKVVIKDGKASVRALPK